MVPQNFKNKRKRVVLLFGILLLGLISCSTASKEMKEDKKIDLADRLGSAYSVINKANKIEVRYCPDNTCDVITASKLIEMTVLDDFLFLYFSRISSYIYLMDFQKSISDKTVESIQEKYKHLCSSKESVTTKCVAKGLSEKYNINLLFARFDEKVESLAPQKIE